MGVRLLRGMMGGVRGGSGSGLIWVLALIWYDCERER
jgi:hypothetical protein